MVIEVGIGGFGDKETKDEARDDDAAVVDAAEVSITDSDISKAKTTTKEKRRENEGGGQDSPHSGVDFSHKNEPLNSQGMII